MKAYILTDPQGQIKDRDQMDLYDGVLALNYDVQLIKEIDIYSKKVVITKNDFFGGHVQLCQWIWKQMGIEDPKLPDYPDELKNYFLRKIKKTTLGNFRKILKENENFGKSYFVKPVKTKLFTGFVCVIEQDLSKLTCSNKTEVYVTSTIDIGAEFRAYVYKGKVVDVHRYAGNDWTVSTPCIDIENIVNKSKINAIFYSIDVGIENNEKRTILIEVNDGYALGNYGLSPIDYAKYTTDRWFEIINN